MTLFSIDIHRPYGEVCQYIPPIYNLFKEFQHEMNIEGLFDYDPKRKIIDVLPLFSEWAMRKYNLCVMFEIQENPRMILTINLGWEDMSVEENEYLLLNMYPEDFVVETQQTNT